MANQGDVEMTAEKIIPTENFVNTIHPHIPSVDKYLQLDGSIDHKNTFIIGFSIYDMIQFYCTMDDCLLGLNIHIDFLLFRFRRLTIQN